MELLVLYDYFQHGMILHFDVIKLKATCALTLSPGVTEATFKCGKKSQIMRYRTCRKWRIVRSCAAEFSELCGKCAMNLIELCDFYTLYHGIVQKMCGR
jgi:hypothetical protein